jgi:acyl carrier protein
MKIVVTGGGELTPADVRSWYSRMPAGASAPALYALYGLTEATLAQMCHEVSVADADSVQLPLGVPRPGIRIRNQPESEVQELIFEGDHLALGVYELPPSAAAYTRFEGVVATGDLVRHERGNWYFAGRWDASFKVDGVSIIPHHVESAIRRRWPGADVAVVKDESTDGVAIFMTRENAPQSNTAKLSSDVRSMLVDQYALLPRCSVQIIEQIPLTERGKPDTSELSRRLDRTRMAPGSIYDFFPGGILARQDTASMSLRELGADSLLLVELAAFLEDRHGVVVDLGDLTSLTPISLTNILSQPPRDRSAPDGESSSSEVSLTQLRFLLHPVALAEPAALNFGWWFAHPDYTAKQLYAAVAAVLRQDDPFSVVFERITAGWHWHSRSMPVPTLQHLNLGRAADEERKEKIYDFVLAPFDLQSDAPKCRIASVGDGRSLIFAGTVLQSDGLTRRNIFRRAQKYLESGSGEISSPPIGWVEILRHRVAVERQRYSADLERMASTSGAPYQGSVRAVTSSFTAHHGAFRDHGTGMVIGAVAQVLHRLGVKHDGIAVPYANRSTPSEWSGLGCFTDTIFVHPRLELDIGRIAADIEHQIAAQVAAFTPLLIHEIRAGCDGPHAGMVMVAGQPSISQWIVNAMPPRYAFNRLHLFWTLDERSGEVRADLVGRCDEFSQSDTNTLARHIKEALLELAPAS